MSTDQHLATLVLFQTRIFHRLLYTCLIKNVIASLVVDTVPTDKLLGYFLNTSKPFDRGDIMLLFAHRQQSLSHRQPFVSLTSFSSPINGYVRVEFSLQHCSWDDLLLKLEKQGILDRSIILSVLSANALILHLVWCVYNK